MSLSSKWFWIGLLGIWLCTIGLIAGIVGSYLLAKEVGPDYEWPLFTIGVILWTLFANHSCTNWIRYCHKMGGVIRG